SRLDEPYKNFPGSWPGIFFGTNRKNQILNYCTIQNAYQGLIFQPTASGNTSQVLLNGCELNNISDIGLGAVSSKITAINCLITNCGFNVYAIAGGDYRFQHCTIASINNNYVEHKNPVFTVSNAGNGQLQNLKCIIENSIIYGEGNSSIENELSTQIANGASFQLQVFNSLVANKKANTAIQFNNSLLNQSPVFDSINISRRIFSFPLKPTSPCIDKGILLSSIITDFVGKNRVLGTLPDMGCYEIK
ncbi:MAG: choice-of-anchor Q domain-containing protein, partial [Chitinophagaceae bacterium]